MFKRKTVRVVAGMLFGSVAGILWGAWYNAAKILELVSADEIAQMNALLGAIMYGSGIGFVVGIVVGLARNSMATGITSALTAAVTAGFLSPGFPFLRAQNMTEGVLAAGGLILLFALVSALLIPKGTRAMSESAA